MNRLVAVLVFALVPVSALADASRAEADAYFLGYDATRDGTLTGTEISECDCATFDANRDRRITKDEFFAGYVRALESADEELEEEDDSAGATGDDDDAPAPPARRTAPAKGGGKRAEAAPAPQPTPRPAPTPEPAPAAGTWKVGDDVDVKWRGRWYPAKIRQARGGEQYFIHYDDHGDSWDEWVGLDRIRARQPKAATKGGRAKGGKRGGPLAPGHYECFTTIATYTGTSYMNGMSFPNYSYSRVRAGAFDLESNGTYRIADSGPYRFEHDATTGAIRWLDGLYAAETKESWNGTGADGQRIWLAFRKAGQEWECSRK